MPRDLLDEDLVEQLNQTTRRTTLKITLGNDAVLRLSTSDIEVDGNAYLGKLDPVDELNLELSRAAEGIKFLISNKLLTLGQTLINTPNALNNMNAVLGCYFKNLQTGEEWHDEKMSGKIEVGKIDGDWIPIFFESLATATVYNGKTIASCFPDAQLPATSNPTPPLPVYDDISNYPLGGGGYSDERAWTFENESYYGRHYLPEIQLAEKLAY